MSHLEESTFVLARKTIPVTARLCFPMWLVATLLTLVTIGIYWPALKSGFINLDDQAYVTANVHVQDGLTLQSVKWAFSNPG